MSSIPSAMDMTQAMVEVSYGLKWNNISVIASDEDYGRDATEQILQHTSTAGLNVVQTYLVQINNEQSIRQTLNKVKLTNSNVFLCVFASSMNLTMFLSLVKDEGMKKTGNVWIFDESFSDQEGISTKTIPEDSPLQGTLFVALNSGLWSDDLNFITRFRERLNFTTVAETYTQIETYDVGINDYIPLTILYRDLPMTQRSHMGTLSTTCVTMELIQGIEKQH